MATYRLTGTLTFASNNARNSAETALLTELQSLPSATAWAGVYPAGLVRAGTGVLTVSYEVTDLASADTLLDRLLTVIASWPRSAGHLSTSRSG